MKEKCSTESKAGTPIESPTELPLLLIIENDVWRYVTSE